MLQMRFLSMLACSISEAFSLLPAVGITHQLHNMVSTSELPQTTFDSFTVCHRKA